MTHLTSPHARSRLLAAAVAGALLAAVPVLVPVAAAAGPTTQLAIEAVGGEASTAAGTCLLFRAVPRDAVHEESVTSAQGAPFITVTLIEPPESSATQDVDFCQLGDRGDEWKSAPSYRGGTDREGLDGKAGVTGRYNPGSTVTPEEPANPVKTRQDVAPAVTTTNTKGQPDMARATATDANDTANNLTGQDKATIAYDSAHGGYFFGVVGLMPGGAASVAFIDQNGDGLDDADTLTRTPPSVRSRETPVTFTAGGPPYSAAAANAVAQVLAASESVSAVAAGGRPATIEVRVLNSTGDPVAGVTPRIAVDAGPNRATDGASAYSASCGASGNDGSSVCSYAPSTPGTDTVSVYVNQSTTGNTAGRDAGEPFDTVTVESVAPTGPSPSPSAAQSPSPAPSTPSAAPTPSTAPAPPRCTVPTTTSLDIDSITATGAAAGTVSATPGSTVQLLGYSRPSTQYRVVRVLTAGPDGTVRFSVRPTTNTRLAAQEGSCALGESTVLGVRPALGMSVVRNGVRTYTFSGTVLPRRAEGQSVAIYRIDSTGGRVLVASTRTAPGGSTWSLRRVFSGAGAFTFVAMTGGDLVNEAGSTAPRPLRVY